MAIITVSTGSTPNQAITPTAPNPAFRTTEVADNVTITATGGLEAIVGYTVETAAGNDTLTLNGSPVDLDVRLGLGNDLFTLNRFGLGGSLTNSTIRGGDGNDTFEVFFDGLGATDVEFRGNEGSDQFIFGGSFDRIDLGAAIGADRITFRSIGSFDNSQLRLGGDDDSVFDSSFARSFANTEFRMGDGDDTAIFTSSTAGTGTDGLLIGGSTGNDRLYGTMSGENTINGGAGADFLQAYAGFDSVTGGGGSDTIVLSGVQGDIAFGDVIDGSDTNPANYGNDVIFAQAGNNTIDAGRGRDIVLAGTGADSILGGEGDFQDLLAGGAGNDTIRGGSGGDLIFGDDIAAGAAGAFVLASTGFAIDVDGNQSTEANVSLTNLVGYVTNNTVNLGADFQDAKSLETSVKDVFTASVTGNILANDDGGLLLDLDSEIDLANTGTGVGLAQDLGYIDVAGYNSSIGEDSGNDSIFGDSGNDTIFGGGGNDTINGGEGFDVIAGGLGSDVMTGGEGNDIFVQGQGRGDSTTATYNQGATNITFNFTALGNPDIITDFVAGTFANPVDQIAFDIVAITETEGLSVTNFIDAQNTPTFAGGSAGNVVVYKGTWNANTGTFATGNSINDTDALVVAPDKALSSGITANEQAVVLLDVGAGTVLTQNNFLVY